MRMWMVAPKFMCRNHLLGEHRECHTLFGSLSIGRSIAGHLSRGQVEPQNLKARHDELADEMSRRGYRHTSPLENFPDAPVGRVDREASLNELMRRCVNCRGGQFKISEVRMEAGKHGEGMPFMRIAGNVSLRERLVELDRSEMSAVLATDGGGQPYTSLVSFALSPDLKGLIFATPKATSKYENMINNPRVSVLIDNRMNAGNNLLRGEAITILGTAKTIRRGKRWQEVARILVEKNPALSDFINAPTTALIYVEAVRYIHVGRFQTVTVSEGLQEIRRPS